MIKKVNSCSLPLTFPSLLQLEELKIPRKFVLMLIKTPQKPLKWLKTGILERNFENDTNKIKLYVTNT